MKTEKQNEIDGIYNNIEHAARLFSIKLAEFINNSTGEIYENLKGDMETLRKVLEEYAKETEIELSSVSVPVSQVEGSVPDISALAEGLKKYMEGSGASSIEGIAKSADKISTSFEKAVDCIIQDTDMEKLSNIQNIKTCSNKYKKRINDPSSTGLVIQGNTSKITLTGYDRDIIETYALGDSIALDAISIDDLNGLYRINACGTGDNVLNLDIRIPAIPFKSIEINSDNSRIRGKNINSSKLIYNLNSSKLSLSSASCSNVEIHAANGEIELSRINCGKIYVIADNTQVWMNDSISDSCSILLENGGANIELPSRIKGGQKLSISSRYADVDIDLHLNEDIYYYLEVICRDGSISCELPGMSLINDVSEQGERHVTYDANDKTKCSHNVNITVSLNCGSARIRDNS